MEQNLLFALSEQGKSRNLSRRQALAAAGGVSLAGLGGTSMFGAGAARAATTLENGFTTMDQVNEAYPGFDWNSPAENMRTLTRMYSSLEPGKEAWLYFFGRGIGTTGPNDYTPLFRLESVAKSIATPQPSGGVRFQAGQLILFCDWDTGEVLDTWKNPYTDEVVDVFHYRDYPVDYEINLAKMEERYSDPTAEGAEETKIHWNFRKDMAYGDVFAVTKNKNKLDPEVWKRESVGEYWETWEHYQWQAPIADIVDKSIPQIKNFYGDIQTWKPFEPFMLMGQQPGKIIQQKSAMSIDGLHQLPKNVRSYIEDNLAQYLDLSDIPKNAYELNDQHYKELREPVS